nr:uncharacterized protein LOC124815006 [Hydra vulgaris]
MSIVQMPSNRMFWSKELYFEKIGECNPMKPKKWGFKIYVLSGVDGLVHNFEIHTGPIDVCPGQPDLKALGNIVMNLLVNVSRQKWHKLYFDNWYTSLELVKTLFTQGITWVGTIIPKVCGATQPAPAGITVIKLEAAFKLEAVIKLEAALATSNSKPVHSPNVDLIETSVVTPIACTKSCGPKKMVVSITDAIENHPLKNSIIIEAQKAVMDYGLHRLLVKVACSYLIDCFGNYPPPEHQLAMAKSIVSTFKFRACRSGNGHELYYCAGTSKGFLTNRFREIYRRYPADVKKYRSRCKKSDGFIAVGDDPAEISNEEYDLIKTKLLHLIYIDRNENEIVELMNKSRLCRQLWIRNDLPTANRILEEFPRFMDTPLLLNDEFQSINRSYVENIPVLLETKISKQIIAYCRLTGKCIDIIGDIDTEGNSNTDALVLKSLKALVYLLPTMGKYRVSPGAAMLFLIEELKERFISKSHLFLKLYTISI